MSHYHAELIFPETDDIAAEVEKLMKPFDENDEEASEPFWDWWVIGGRFSGAKLQARVGRDRMDAFYEKLKAEKVTVSSLQCGKQELQPADQIPAVDAMWSEMFPEFKGKCPIFAHYNDQYGKDGEIARVDVCTVADIPKELTCSTLIIGGPEPDRDRPTMLLHQSIWNGVTHQDTAFKGNVLDGLKQYAEKMSHWRADYAEKRRVRDNWLVVTVDYHS